MLTALCLVALVGSAALGVDLGDIYMKTRQLQGVADLAAMASVESLDPAASQSPAATAQATAGLNPWPGGITAQAVTGPLHRRLLRSGRPALHRRHRQPQRGAGDAAGYCAALFRRAADRAAHPERDADRRRRPRPVRPPSRSAQGSPP